MALPWLLVRKPWVVPVPGTTKQNHLEGNLVAVRVELTAADVKEVKGGFAGIRVQGARALEEFLAVYDIGANLGTTSAGGHGKTPLPGKRPP